MTMTRHDLWVYAFNTFSSPTVSTLGSINLQRLEDVAKTIGQPDLTDWEFYLPVMLQRDMAGMDQLRHREAAYFFFVQTALQYCFWDFDADGNQTHWCYKGDPKAKGSRGCVAMTIDMYDKGVFPGLCIRQSDVRRKLAKYVADMPNAESRLDILEEVGNYEKFCTEVYNPLLLSGTASTELASKMAAAFPKAFADPFLKKAQLVLGLIVTNFAPRKIAIKPDLTAYSDYRVPQVLRHLGIITYSDELAQKVDNGELIASGSAEEKAIRAMTILACARLAAESGLTDMEIDSWLFEQSRDEDFQKNAKPFHLTKTTDY
ncbi:MAG: hypothetical protein CMF62_09930 [Magnetococcales bacterium]|nr:hypothetical protein [Magnetococcales bacterium]|tara:strand:+ start:305769 stop:306722 length:954 start_codon:yes stop_codon:yes gene_type:complete